MRLVLALFLLLFLFPTFLGTGVSGLRSGQIVYDPITFAEARVPDTTGGRHVEFVGDLVRFGTPSEHTAGSLLYYPVTAAGQGTDLAAWAQPDAGLPIVARANGDDLPVELFARPRTGTPALSVPDVRLFGSRYRSVTIPKEIARSFFPGDPNAAERKVVLIGHGPPPINRPTGVVFVVLALIVLYFGVRTFRTWRRLRRERKEDVAGTAHFREPSPVSSSQNVGATPPKRSGFKLRMPGMGAMKAIGAAVIGIAIIAARLGGDAAPMLDDVARGTARGAAGGAKRSGDAAASAATRASGRASDLAGTAGDVALEGAGVLLGNAGTLKTVSDLRKEIGRAPSGTLSAEYSLTRMRESYKRIDGTLFEMSSISNEWEMTRGSQRESGKDRDLPDRDAGEYEQLRFERAVVDGPVVLHLTTGTLAVDGWVDSFTVSAEVEFIVGDWSSLMWGGRAVLQLTEKGRDEYGRGQAQLIDRVTTQKLPEEGFIAGRVYATPRAVPQFRYAIEGDKLTIGCDEPLTHGLRITYWR